MFQLLKLLNDMQTMIKRQNEAMQRMEKKLNEIEKSTKKPKVVGPL